MALADVEQTDGQMDAYLSFSTYMLVSLDVILSREGVRPNVTTNLWGPFFAPPALTSFDAIVDFVRGVRRSSFVRSFVVRSFKKLGKF